MLSGEGLTSKKKSNFARAAHFFPIFLCRCLARLQRETSRNFLVASFMEGMSYMFSFRFFFFFFFIAAHFHFAMVAASFSYFVTTASKFSCCSSNKKCLLRFFSLALDLCRPFSR